MTAPGTAGADDAELFKRLSGLLSIPIVLGTQADAENTAAERITFIPKRLGNARLRFEPEDGDGIREQRREYNVSIYGSDWGRLCRIHRELWGKLFEVLTESAFEMGQSDEPKSGGPGSTSWSVVVPVIINGPIYAQIWGEGTSTTVTPGLFVSKPDGAGPEEVGAP